jgi:hypothetical protein
MRTDHIQTKEGLLTHVAAADCFITRPHPALKCGIVTAWWQSQVEAGGPPALPFARSPEVGG